MLVFYLEYIISLDVAMNVLPSTVFFVYLTAHSAPDSRLCILSLNMPLSHTYSFPSQAINVFILFFLSLVLCNAFFASERCAWLHTC